jgi:hypothetical protein
MKIKYPKHLEEKIREEVALSYLKHELRKIFPSIDNREILGLMNSKELCNPRDFWNGLHGVSMGFKLKNILYLVTAENIVWKREKVKCNEIYFGVELDSTKKIKPGKISGEEYFDFYLNDENRRTQELKNVLKIRGNNAEREKDPIIIIKKEELMSVHDGNGRLARHILEKESEIEAFVGTMKGKEPVNYWLPTSFLVEFLFYVYQVIDSNNEELFIKQIAVLKNMLSRSKSGMYEFKERALTKKEPYRSKILGELGYLSAADN